MGCASSKQLETVLKAEGLETINRKRSSRFLARRSQSHKYPQKRQNQNQNQNQNQKQVYNHHVSLTSSTYGVLEPAPEPKSATADSPKRCRSFDSASRIIEKLGKLEGEEEDGKQSPQRPPPEWSEVSKILDNLRPNGHAQAPLQRKSDAAAAAGEVDLGITVHTVEELDATIAKAGEDKSTIQTQPEPEPDPKPAVPEALAGYEERCPAGGEQSVVVYTTSLRGIRKTFEDCNRVRAVLQGLGVAVDERDVAMEPRFRDELRQLMGGPSTTPRLFVRGRYIGGADDVLHLHDDGVLAVLLGGMSSADPPRPPCAGCAGVRFVPCTNCSGSRKIVAEDLSVERCNFCNENGLIHCPMCAAAASA